jgi:hypothetical protein
MCANQCWWVLAWVAKIRINCFASAKKLLIQPTIHIPYVTSPDCLHTQACYVVASLCECMMIRADSYTRSLHDIKKMSKNDHWHLRGDLEQSLRAAETAVLPPSIISFRHELIRVNSSNSRLATRRSRCGCSEERCQPGTFVH